ncbi:MAG: anthranilate phosphoribosyltransferase [Elusimicrobia bacterium]|nr:anthranilate phosphoribosyltransferase [Elusimicrobiota bacterium]
MNSFSLLIEHLLSGSHLSESHAFSAMQSILKGQLTQVQIAGFLTALRSKKESPYEIIGYVKAMRESMIKITPKVPLVLDTCGTGGDGKGTFNISTAAAFVVAGAGVAVAKHGNRSVSSSCGSADVLEALGIKIDCSKEQAEKCLNEIGISFLFAPLYHPAMKNVAPVRKELGIRTIFNTLGPLVNPASPNAQIIGVANRNIQATLGAALRKSNLVENKSIWVIHDSGYDEIILSEKGLGLEIRGKKLTGKTLSASEFGLQPVKLEDLEGGDAKKNAELLKNILSGLKHPLKNVILANAACALFCADQISKNQYKNLKDAVSQARDSLEKGAALKKLGDLIEWSNR